MIEVFKAIHEEMRRGATSTMVTRGRRVAESQGVKPNPVGLGNGKTDLPGTYRPVGPSCPASCPWLDEGIAQRSHGWERVRSALAVRGGCYAQRGNVAIHERRAVSEVNASVVAAFIAMVAGARTGAPTRLHVSGDFAAQDGSVDVAYIEGLCKAARFVSRKYREAFQCFTYTAFEDETFEPYRVRLARAGIVVLSSNTLQAGGTILRPSFKELRAQRALIEAQSGAKLLLCLAQLTDKAVTCRECIRTTGGCLKAKERGFIIGFEADGNTTKAITAVHEATT